MSQETVKSAFLGPFHDLRRFLVGAVSPPPPTRKQGTAELAAVRAILTEAGCDLSRCIGENLHTATTDLPADQVFELLRHWQLWPSSAFFACPSIDREGMHWFSYRFYKLVPIVVMRLKVEARPYLIIYDLVRGIGAGGYHSFLVDTLSPGCTQVSIFTIFPPTVFLTGLHDQTNADIYRKLAAIAAAQHR